MSAPIIAYPWQNVFFEYINQLLVSTIQPRHNQDPFKVNYPRCQSMHNVFMHSCNHVTVILLLVLAVGHSSVNFNLYHCRPINVSYKVLLYCTFCPYGVGTHSLVSYMWSSVRSNTHDIHPSVTPSAALQLICRLRLHDGT